MRARASRSMDKSLLRATNLHYNAWFVIQLDGLNGQKIRLESSLVGLLFRCLGILVDQATVINQFCVQAWRSGNPKGFKGRYVLGHPLMADQTNSMDKSYN